MPPRRELSPKASVYKFTFTDGAGESQLAIFKTPYSWLGKTYYSANLSGLLFYKGITPKVGMPG